MEMKKMAVVAVALIIAVTVFAGTYCFKELQVEQLRNDQNQVLLHAQGQIDDLRIQVTNKSVEASNLSYVIALKEDKIVNLQKEIEMDNAQILKLEADCSKFVQDAEILSETIASKTEEINSLKDLIKQYCGQIESLTDQVSDTTKEIETLRDQVETLKKPQLILLDMKIADCRQFWFWDTPTHLHINGYIVNLNEEIANADLSWKIHTSARGSDGQTLIDNYQEISTVQGNSWISVSYDVYYGNKASPARFEVTLERCP